MKEMILTSSIGYPKEFPDVIAMLRENGNGARDLISDRYCFDEIFAALETARSRDSGKVMVRFPDA